MKIKLACFFVLLSMLVITNDVGTKRLNATLGPSCYCQTDAQVIIDFCDGFCNKLNRGGCKEIESGDGECYAGLCGTEWTIKCVTWGSMERTFYERCSGCPN